MRANAGMFCKSPVNCDNFVLHVCAINVMALRVKLTFEIIDE